MKIRLPIPSRNTFTTIILEWLEKLYKINNSVTSRFITVSYGLNGMDKPSLETKCLIEKGLE